MTSVDFITELFCRIDDAMTEVHPQSVPVPSEIVTMCVLFMKDVRMPQLVR